MNDLADALEARLKKLDAECEEGIYDPVRTYEDTAKVARDAIAALRKLDGSVVTRQA